MQVQNKAKLILPNNKHLSYTGRIDFSDPKMPMMVFPYTSVEFSFVGTSLSVTLINKNLSLDNYLGVILDGKQSKIKLSKSEEEQQILIAEGLEHTKHTVKIFKRQDACHLLKFVNIILHEEGELLAPEVKLHRRMEFYGDSVTAGEVSEAIEYEGKVDPEHSGEYSNSWFGYSTIASRKLQAEAHLVAQGGIPLLDNTGYFSNMGMENVYDKCQYNPGFGNVTKWDFDKYHPHIVIVAIAQNDAHPVDFMKEDYNGSQSIYWRSKYMELIKNLREKHKEAIIILQTTILNHDASWDRAISEVLKGLNDGKIYQLKYKRNGCGTPGHLRISEAEEMAQELVNFIDGLGEHVWMD